MSLLNSRASCRASCRGCCCECCCGAAEKPYASTDTLARGGEGGSGGGGRPARFIASSVAISGPISGSMPAMPGAAAKGGNGAERWLGRGRGLGSRSSASQVLWLCRLPASVAAASSVQQRSNAPRRTSPAASSSSSVRGRSWPETSDGSLRTPEIALSLGAATRSISLWCRLLVLVLPTSRTSASAAPPALMRMRTKAPLSWLSSAISP